MFNLFKLLDKFKEQTTPQADVPKYSITQIGNFDQLRVMSRDDDGNIYGMAIFRNGSALKIRSSAEEYMEGQPLHKVHFDAGTGGAKSIFEKVDDILKSGDHAVKRALYTFPHLPQRRAEFFGDLSL